MFFQQCEPTQEEELDEFIASIVGDGELNDVEIDGDLYNYSGDESVVLNDSLGLNLFNAIKDQGDRAVLLAVRDIGADQLHRYLLTDIDTYLSENELIPNIPLGDDMVLTSLAIDNITVIGCAVLTNNLSIVQLLINFIANDSLQEILDSAKEITECFSRQEIKDYLLQKEQELMVPHVRFTFV